MVTWDKVFEPTPSWGMRGDPFAWFMLRARLCMQELSEDPAGDADLLRGTFRQVIGLDLADPLLPQHLFVKAFDFYGMSSGMVDLHRWRDKVLPLLIARAARLRVSPGGEAADVPVWQGMTGAPAVADSAAEKLATTAKAGDWSRVLDLLDHPHVTANTWRPSGTSHYTPLHQAAWHGAPVDVVQQLLDRGAWRTLRTAKGQRAVDIAQQRGHAHLIEALTPPALDQDADVLPDLDRQLAALVESRIRPHLDVPLRHPQCEVLTEIPSKRLWYPVPGMYGGFSVALREAHLYVESWVRVVGGSGQAHVVTRERSTLVREGFV